VIASSAGDARALQLDLEARDLGTEVAQLLDQVVPQIRSRGPE
jgi:hypothetical protein